MGIEQYAGRVALVTGASSGIGAAIAQALQRKGLVVVGIARRVDRIKALDVPGAPGKLYALEADVAKEEDIVNAFQWVKQNLGGVDILINNAGIVIDEDLTSGDTSGWRKMLDVNVIGLSICTREAVKGMRERGVNDGYIIHISSIVGHVLPIYSAIAMYSASKYAVKALTEGLRKDLVASQSQIRNTTISPGVVETEVMNNAKSFDKNFFKTIPSMQPEDIGEIVIFILSQPPRVQILLHNPAEFPPINLHYFRVPLNQEVIAAERPNMMTTSEGLRGYSPHRRQCDFPYERHLRFFRVYTQHNCNLECLANYTLQSCGCVSYYMPRAENTPICGSGSTECVQNSTDNRVLHEIEKHTQLSMDINLGGISDCDCMPACTVLEYDTETSKVDFDWPNVFAAYETDMSEFPG